MAVMTDSFGAGGGIAQYNRDWILAAVANGVQVDLLAYTRVVPAPEDLPTGVTLICATAVRWRLTIEALRLARRRVHDVVYCGHLHLAPVAAFAAQLARARLWVQAHGVEIWTRPGMLRRLATQRATLVTAVSRYTRGRVLGWLGGPPHRVRVLPNTVGEGFSPGPRDAAYARQLGLDGAPVLLTVGRLSATERYKGHDRVLLCLAKLRATYPQLRYVIAGDGDDSARLSGVAGSLGVSDLVRFVGNVEAQHLPQLFRLADVFVMPSTGEGFGIAFLEAMACGVPAIGLDVDGSSDPLADGQLGLCVRPDEVCAAIKRVLGQATEHSHRVDTARFGRQQFELHWSLLCRNLQGAQR